MVQKYNIILIWHLYLFTLNVELFCRYLFVFDGIKPEIGIDRKK